MSRIPTENLVNAAAFMGGFLIWPISLTWCGATTEQVMDSMTSPIPIPFIASCIVGFLAAYITNHFQSRG